MTTNTTPGAGPEQDAVERLENAINAYIAAWDVSRRDGRSAPGAHQAGLEAAIAAMPAPPVAVTEAMERLEDVLRERNWEVTVSHGHTSDGLPYEDGVDEFSAYVKDWHTGRDLAEGIGSTLDAAIRAALDAVMEATE